MVHTAAAGRGARQAALTYHYLGLLYATMLEVVDQRLNCVRHVLVPDVPGRTVCVR